MAHFFNSFEPFRGDILYGISEQRGEYIEKYLKSSQYAEYEREHGKFKATTRYYMINNYNEPLGTGDFTRPDEIDLKVNEGAHIQYINSLTKHPKYAPRTTAKASPASIAKSDNRLNDPNTPKPSDKEMADLLLSLSIRKACKFGIEYIAEIKKVLVHYVLDGITMEDVAVPAVRRIYNGNIGVPITTSELRYLFREWGRFRDTGKVRFYNMYIERDPPWYAKPALWVPYARDRVAKYRTTIKSADALGKFDKAVVENDHRKAIDLFHEMRVGV